MERSTMFMLTALAASVGLVSGGIGSLLTENKAQAAPPPPPIINQTIETKNDEPAKPAGCLGGAKGTVQSTFSEKVSLAEEKDPEAWTWGTQITFKVDDETILCRWSGPYQLDKTIKPGMMINVSGGERIL